MPGPGSAQDRAQDPAQDRPEENCTPDPLHPCQDCPLSPGVWGSPGGLVALLAQVAFGTGLVSLVLLLWLHVGCDSPWTLPPTLPQLLLRGPAPNWAGKEKKLRPSCHAGLGR